MKQPLERIIEYFKNELDLLNDEIQKINRR